MSDHIPAHKEVLWVTKADILRLGINCRCGQRSVYETARQVQQVDSLHACPKCGVFFRVSRDPKTGKWNTQRTEMTTSNTVFVDASKTK